MPASASDIEAFSLLGRPLRPPALAGDVEAERTAQLEAARRAWERDPDDEEAVIWYGRRAAYLGAYRRAIEIYTEGLERHPDSSKLLRHRGHRFLTVRRPDLAIRDLRRAAALIEGVPDEVEPDGLPNRLGRPTSTSHTNVHYHLGLARYVGGAFDEAAASWRACLDLATNDDMRCAASYWLYLALRRLGRDEAAAAVLGPITAELEVIENHAYHQLLLLFKGALGPDQIVPADSPVGAAIDDATVAYGVAMWHELRGEPARARAMLRRIVDGPAWPAFGHLAAEAELAR